jgi:hypothetical protein
MLEKIEGNPKALKKLKGKCITGKVSREAEKKNRKNSI